MPRCQLAAHAIPSAEVIRLARVAFLSVSFLSLCGVLRCAVAAPIEPGREYPGGSKLDSPWTGISFVVPAGFSGGYDGEAGAVLLGSQTAAMLLGIYGSSEGDAEVVGAAVVGKLESQGIRLAPVELDSREDGTLVGVYQAMTEEGPGTLVGVVRTGPHGGTVVVAALGRLDQRDALLEQVEAVLTTVTFAPPQAKSWRQRLAGVRLAGGGGDSHYSPGGAGGYGSYASDSEEWMEFCPDGSYVYKLHKESYFSIEGASAESTEHDEHQGSWWLVSDIGGQALLVLEATDGREFHWSIAETESGASVNGVAYGATAATLCR